MQTTGNEIKILVCFHKEYMIPKDDIYFPIHVGKAGSVLSMNMQADNLCNGEPCDNISDLNPWYCEMTAMYWAWKNIRKVYPGIRYVGLCHYRRYFCAKKHSVKFTARNILGTGKMCLKVLLGRGLGSEIQDRITQINTFNSNLFTKSNQKLISIIKASDITATYPIKLLNQNVLSFFEQIGRDYIIILGQIINDRYPEYKDAYQRVLAGSRLIAANMIILKTEYLDSYCDFMFTIMNTHMQEVSKTGLCIDPKREKIYARIPGYLAELLTNTYIERHKNSLKVSYVEKFFVNNQQ